MYKLENVFVIPYTKDEVPSKKINTSSTKAIEYIFLCIFPLVPLKDPQRLPFTLMEKIVVVMHCLIQLTTNIWHVCFPKTLRIKSQFRESKAFLRYSFKNPLRDTFSG